MRTVKNPSENLNGQLASEYPVVKATAIDITTDGTVMITDRQKFGLMPLQSSPVQAVNQALYQGANVGCAGGKKNVAFPNGIEVFDRCDQHDIERHQKI